MDVDEARNHVSPPAASPRHSSALVAPRIHRADETCNNSHHDSRNDTCINPSVTAFDHDLVARNAELNALEEESAAKVARAIALELHNHRMRRARASAAQADVRLASALEEVRKLEEESTAAVREEDHRGVSDRTPAASLDDVKPAPRPPASLSMVSYTARGLIFLGSDSSDDESD